MSERQFLSTRRSSDGRTRTSSSARCGRAGSASSSARSGSRSSSRSPSRRPGRPRRGARPRAARRPAGPRQDDARPHRPRGARRRHPLRRRPGARAQGRHRGDPHRARAARRPLRRRDPPPEPRRRGDPLPGARGLPARHRRRPGAGGAHADARPAALHARRRDDAHGPADDAAARPLRHDLPARLLRDAPTWPRSSGARRGSSASRSRPRPPTRSPRRSRGTPRIANRILRRVRDVAEVRHAGRGHRPRSPARRSSCSRWTSAGLEHIDRELLRAIVERFDGGPVGLSTLAVALGEEPDTIEDVYEPYLLQLGFIQRTPRGRIVTKLGRAHVGAAGAAAPITAPLFEAEG